MKEIQYLTPTQVIKHKERSHRDNYKFAYIIPIHIRADVGELVAGRRRNKKEIEKKGEYIHFREVSVDMIDFTLACAKHYRSGIKNLDIIIIDNGSVNLKELDKVRKICKKNEYIFMQRENVGFAHGAFKYVWDMFKEKYDFYYVNEQDYMPCRHDWLKEMYDIFIEDKDIGAIGTVIEGVRSMDLFEIPKFAAWKVGMKGDYWKNKGAFQCNTAGTDMFTSSVVLKEVDDIGGLNIVDSRPIGNLDWDIDPVINELFWMHPILDLGYKLSGFNDGSRMITHGKGYLDFENEDNFTLDSLAPLCHAQTLYHIDKMREYFSWYKNIHKFNLKINASCDILELEH